MQNQPTTPKQRSWKDSISIRLIIVAALVLLLLIPTAMVQNLIDDRQYTNRSAISEVSQRWSKEQVITGPFVSIPYIEYQKKDDELIAIKHYAHFLPNELSIDGDIVPEMRHRGIFDVVVYRTNLSVNGVFPTPDFSQWPIKPSEILWSQAKLSFGISDLRGIENQLTMQWGSDTLRFDPGLENTDVVGSGVSSSVAFAEKELKFSFQLNLKGSQTLSFTPIGKTNDIKLQSSWKNPSFKGNFLPVNHTINEQGFSANWKVLHLNRNYPQQWIDETQRISSSEFMVELYVPADQYQKSTRTAKYAIMFISLTFVLFFFVEVLNAKRIHPIQYLLVGFALILFFTLLLSISEHLGFNNAYIISALATLALIGVYVRSVLGSNKLTAITTSVLALLYGFIFVTLQLQDYALLLGSIGLFIVLSTIMFLSRKINWYAISTDTKS